MILSYCRVSTLEQANASAASLPEQERQNKLVASLRGASAFDLSQYVDAGVSGGLALSARPAGGKMLAEARKGDIIVATKLDRLFRNALDALRTIDELREREIDLIVGDISGTETLANSPTAKCFFTMLAAFAELEHRRIAERITEGKTRKRGRGGFMGGHAPYGWKVVGQGRTSVLETDEREQAIIAQIKETLDRKSVV